MAKLVVEQESCVGRSVPSEKSLYRFAQKFACMARMSVL